jgi:hypothetical protein
MSYELQQDRSGGAIGRIAAHQPRDSLGLIAWRQRHPSPDALTQGLYGDSRLEFRTTDLSGRENLLLSDIPAAADNAVTESSGAAQTRAGQPPAAAAHTNDVAQQIAGVTLDALRTWRRAAG